MEKIFKKIMRQSITSVILAIGLLLLIFGFGAKGFASYVNISNILKATSVITVAGLAQMCVLGVGQFNLAVGAMGCLSSMVFAWSMQILGLPVTASVVIGIGAGALLGFSEGILVSKTTLNPFIVTLALNSIFLGIATVVFKNVLLNQIPDSVKQLNRFAVLKIPLILILAVVISAAMYIFMKKTVCGRKLLAAGESKKAAEIAGLKPRRQFLIAHTLSGLLAAIAGIMTVSRMGAAQLTVGDDWMMMSFAAPVLGGTLLSGGKVAPLGTILGALLLNVVNYGLLLMNVNMYWSQAILGLVLIAAFALDYMHERAVVKGIK